MRTCTRCQRPSKAVFSPVIGYGADPDNSVIRVDETHQLCHNCIRVFPKERPIGVVVDWQITEEEEEDDD